MLAEEIRMSEEFSREGSLVEFMQKGQKARESLSSERNYNVVQGIQLEEINNEAIEQVYPIAADDVDFYMWSMGEGQEDEYFVLNEETESIDQENAFRSRMIRSENAKYHLAQENEDGDLSVDMHVEGNPMFSVENHGDFEDLWSRIQGKEAEIVMILALIQTIPPRVSTSGSDTNGLD